MSNQRALLLACHVCPMVRSAFFPDDFELDVANVIRQGPEIVWVDVADNFFRGAHAADCKS